MIFLHYHKRNKEWVYYPLFDQYQSLVKYCDIFNSRSLKFTFPKDASYQHIEKFAIDTTRKLFSGHHNRDQYEADKETWREDYKKEKEQKEKTEKRIKKLTVIDFETVTEFNKMDSPLHLAIYCTQKDRKPYKPRNFLKHINDIVVSEIDKGNARIIISSHRRSGKTLYLIWLSIWLFVKDPEHKIIMCSATDPLAQEWSRLTRNMILKYQDKLGIELSPDVQAKKRWTTKTEAQYLSVGLGGSCIGSPANTLLIDDSIKSLQDALSPAETETRNDFVDSVLIGCLQPGNLAGHGNIIVNNTRWSRQDLIGHFLESAADKKWIHINLPAIAVENDPLGRVPGEALIPDDFPIEFLHERRKALGTLRFEIEYQGNLNAEGGNIIKISDIMFYKAIEKPEKFDEQIISVDASFGADKDKTAFGVFGKSGSKIYLLNMIAGFYNFNETLQQLISLMKTYPDAKKRLIEKSANGWALIQKLNNVNGIIGISPKESKIIRCLKCTPTFESHNYFIPDKSECPWVGDYLIEILSFPHGSHDDRLDVTTQAINYFTDSEFMRYHNASGFANIPIVEKSKTDEYTFHETRWT